ncbi:MAG TPA: DUF4185 domain-containing protein [Verrucomicrobiae bacterium]|nr:DUF4185 domain-containing protein [Verrucomicrobiae bacterium]
MKSVRDSLATRRRAEQCAAVILSSATLAGAAAKGAVVYTQYNNLTIIGRDGSSSFDLSPSIQSRFQLFYQDANSQKPTIQGDGVHSFVLARTWQNTNAMDLNNRTYGGLPLTPEGIVVDGGMLDVNSGKQQNGLTNLTVQTTGYFIDRPDNNDAGSGGSKSIYAIGDWGTGATNSGYVGLVLVNGGVTNFGWAHFNWSVPTSDSRDTNARLTLIDAAYETAPNTGIQTGEGIPAFGSPETAADWFQLFQAKNDWTWSGSDQVTSYRAANGLNYWMFGDTILGTRNEFTGGYNAGWKMVANSILIESNGVLSAATSVPAVPDAANGDRYWVQGMFEANAYLYCQCARVRNASGGLGFQLYGAEFAKFQFQPNGQLTFLGMIPTPGTGIPEAVGRESIQWTRDVVVDEGYVYVFGDTLTGNAFSPKASYVSRVAQSDIENPAAWRFWNSSTWVTDSTTAVVVIPDMISSVRRYAGKWVVLYKPFAGFGDQVWAQIASAPQGPYGSPQLIFSSPGGSVSNGVTTDLHCYQTYSPQAHPQYPLTNGKLLVSIAWNGCDLFQDTAHDARLYKPRFYEVALSGVPVSLNLKVAGGLISLSWPTGTLMEASSLSGPWTTNHATSPCMINPISGQKFYRVKVR